MRDAQAEPIATELGLSRLACQGVTENTQGWAITEAKEHHFVPQFYLKNVGQGKSIRLFNFERRKHIPGAPIKIPCARHKLHAFSPGLEQKLSVVEGAAATAIRCILADGMAPASGSETWLDALGFLILQKLRTARAIQSVDTLADFMLEHAPRQAWQATARIGSS